MKKNQNGFGLIEGLLILAIVALLGSTGWYVWHKNQKPSNKLITGNSSAQTKVSKSEQPVGVITSGPGAEWNTYTNNSLKFSIQIPKQYLSSNGAQCTKVSYVYDDYGNKVPSQPSYIPAKGVVPATVIEDGSNFYVVEEYTYQPTDKASDGSGHTLASDCQKIETTVDAINRNKQTNFLLYYELNLIPFSVVSVNSQQDILNWAQNKFNDKTVTVAGMKDNSGGWQDLELACSSSNPCTDFNYKFYLRYYKNQNKLVYLEQGQSGHLQTPNGENFYDGQVIDSFKLIN